MQSVYYVVRRLLVPKLGLFDHSLPFAGRKGGTDVIIMLIVSFAQVRASQTVAIQDNHDDAWSNKNLNISSRNLYNSSSNEY